MTEQPTNKGNRWTLLALVAIFLAPVLAAIFLNSRWSDFAPEAERNYGTLVHPVQPLPPAARERLPADQWVLLAPPGACRDDCAALADLLERIDRALGRHGESLQPIIMTARPLTLPPHVRVLDDAPQLELVVTRSAAGSPLVLIDPLGNVMMRYPADFEAKGVIDDLERLIRYSRFEAAAEGGA